MSLASFGTCSDDILGFLPHPYQSVFACIFDQFFISIPNKVFDFFISILVWLEEHGGELRIPADAGLHLQGDRIGQGSLAPTPSP